jgi:hypothetical protein
MEVRQQGREVAATEAEGSADAQVPAHHAAARGEHLLQFIGLRADHGPFLVQQLAFVRQPHAARRAVDQADAVHRFDLLQPLRDGRRRNIQLARCGHHAARLDKHLEEANVVEHDH